MAFFLPSTRTHGGSFMLDCSLQVSEGMPLGGVLIPQRFA